MRQLGSNELRIRHTREASLRRAGASTLDRGRPARNQRPEERVSLSARRWIGTARPSRRPRCGLLRMRIFYNDIKSLPHPEEARSAVSKDAYFAVQRQFPAHWRLLQIPRALRQADLAQYIADAACGAQFAADIGREPQIAFGVEPAGFGIRRQFAHDLGEGAEDRLDIARLEPPFPGHADLRSSKGARRPARAAYQNSASWSPFCGGGRKRLLSSACGMRGAKPSRRQARSKRAASISAYGPPPVMRFDQAES